MTQEYNPISDLLEEFPSPCTDMDINHDQMLKALLYISRLLEKTVEQNEMILIELQVLRART